MANLDYNYIAELVSQIREGESNAFAELYASTYQEQFEFSLDFLKDTQLAREALQQTFVYALKNINKLTDASLVIPWLNLANIRTCVAIRFREDRHAENPTVAAGSAEKQTIDVEGETYTLQKLYDLPFTESQVLLLRYLCHMKPRAIARMAGLNRSAVRQYVQSGRERLKGYHVPEEGKKK